MKSEILVISSACFTSINRKVYQYFQKNGHNINIVIPKKMKFSGNYKIYEPKEFDEPNLIPLDLIGSNSRIYYFKDLIKKLNLIKPNIIIVDNEASSLLSIIVSIWCLIKKVDFYCICYENISLSFIKNTRRNNFNKIPANLLKKILLIFSKLFVKNIFTINFESQSLYKKYGFKNVQKIPLGFDSEVFHINDEQRSIIRSKYKIKDKLVISYFGRLCHEKGIHVLLESLLLLKNDNWILLIDEFKDYKSNYVNTLNDFLKNKLLIDKVIFINPTHKNIANYMNASDIVILPSITTNNWVEQYGRVIPESMACGKIVIGSNSGAIPMLIDKYGFLFEESNYKELKNIIEHVDTNKEKYFSLEHRQLISNYALQNLSVHKQYKMMSLILNLNK